MTIFGDLRFLALFKRATLALESLAADSRDRRNDQIAAREARKLKKVKPFEIGTVDWDAVNQIWKRERAVRMIEDDEEG
jgi:hypothetical protein